MKNDDISSHCVSCTELLALCVVVVVSQHRCSITAKELGRSRTSRQGLNTRKAGPAGLALSMRPCGLFGYGISSRTHAVAMVAERGG